MAANNGNKVSVHYKGSLSDGKVFDSSEGREPLEFVLGAGNMIPGFEKGVLGMNVGETKTVIIPAAEAYGPYYEEMVMTVGRDCLPQGMSPIVGDKLQTRDDRGRTMVVVVKEITDTTITVDGNHELAGKDLTFEIRLVKVA